MRMILLMSAVAFEATQDVVQECGADGEKHRRTRRDPGDGLDLGQAEDKPGDKREHAGN